MVGIVPFSFLYLFALIFGFFDGFHGSANIVATAIFSRSMQMHYVLLLAATAVFVGPFLFGIAVAETIGKDLADPHYFTIPVTLAAVLAAILWKLITGWLGLPSSSSHSLLGGLVGAVVAGHGTAVLQSDGLIKVTIALILSPTLGLVFGYLVMNAILFLARGASPRINEFFKRGHIVTAVTLALSHGTNNAQKTMGIIALGLVGTGLNQDFTVPVWVVASSAAALAVGTLFGGRRVIRTVGGRFYNVRPVHSFASQNTAAVIILGAALLGGPVSTTQTVSSTIVGVGSAERLSKVRWAVFYEIGLAWILTIPATVLMAALLYFLINGLTLL